MKEYFKTSDIYNCDCYVADYTDQTKNRQGVVIARIPFHDIDYFHLKKSNQSQNTPYLAINLEQYKSFTKGIENCECIFYSLAECRKPWVMFLETKYCKKPEKIEEYSSKTISQMESTLCRLEKLKLMNRRDHRVYFVYSVPGQKEYEPFYSFVNSPDKISRYKEEGIHLFGYNSILIATSSHLLIPPKKV